IPGGVALDVPDLAGAADRVADDPVPRGDTDCAGVRVSNAGHEPFAGPGSLVAPAPRTRAESCLGLDHPRRGAGALDGCGWRRHSRRHRNPNLAVQARLALLLIQQVVGDE